MERMALWMRGRVCGWDEIWMCDWKKKCVDGTKNVWIKGRMCGLSKKSVDKRMGVWMG